MQYFDIANFTFQALQEQATARSFLNAGKPARTPSPLSQIFSPRLSEDDFLRLTPSVSLSRLSPHSPHSKLSEVEDSNDGQAKQDDEDVEIRFMTLRSPSWSGGWDGRESYDTQRWRPRLQTRIVKAPSQDSPTETLDGNIKLAYDGVTGTPQESDLELYAETGYQPPVKTQDESVSKEAKLVGTLLHPKSDDFNAIDNRLFINIEDELPNSNHLLTQRLKNLSQTQIGSNGKRLTSIFKTRRFTSKKMIEAWKKKFTKTPDTQRSDRVADPQESRRESMPSSAPYSYSSDRVVRQGSKHIRKATTMPENSSSDAKGNLSRLHSRSTMVNGSPMKIDVDGQKVVHPCYMAGEATRISTPSTAPVLPSSTSTREPSPLDLKSTTFPSYFDMSMQRPKNHKLIVPAKRQTHGSLPGVTPNEEFTTDERDVLTSRNVQETSSMLHKYSSAVASPLVSPMIPPPTIDDLQIFERSDSAISTPRRATHPFTHEGQSSSRVSDELYRRRRSSYAYGELIRLLSKSNDHSSQTDVQSRMTDTSYRKSKSIFVDEKHYRRPTVTMRDNSKRPPLNQRRSSLLSYASDNLRTQHIGEITSFAEEEEARRTSLSIPLVRWRGCMVTEDESKRLDMFFKTTSSPYGVQACASNVQADIEKSPSISKRSDSSYKVPKITTDYVVDMPENLSSSKEKTSLSTSDGYDDSDEDITEMYAQACQEIQGSAIGVVRRTKTFNQDTDLPDVRTMFPQAEQDIDLDFVNIENLESRNEDSWKTASMLYNRVLHQPSTRKMSARSSSIAYYRQEHEKAPEVPFFEKSDVNFLTSVTSSSPGRSVSDSRMLEERFNSMSSGYTPFKTEVRLRRSSVSGLLRNFSFGSLNSFTWKHDGRIFLMFDIFVLKIH